MKEFKKPSIYEFSSYAEFFSAYVKAKKRADSSYSLNVMARSLGLKSSSILSMIGRGERFPQPDLLIELGKYMSLTVRESQYAEALAGFEQAKTSTELTHYSERLRVLKPLNEDVLLGLDVFDLICHWHNGAILEMASLREFRPDPEWIAARLGNKVSVEDAATALELLVRLKLLVKDKQGSLRKSAAGFISGASVPSQAIRSFHRQMLDKAHAAIEEQPVGERCFSGSTISIEQDKVPLATELIGDFIEEFKKRMGSQSGDEVYHVAVQFFRVTQS